jgi:hypothetical protein
MSVTKKLLEASGGGGDPAYVDDVFSTYLYEGTGSTQTITNGIDLDGEGGLVWIKNREQTERHWWVDTERGVNYGLDSSDTIAQVNLTSVNAFNSNGFSVTGTSDIWNGSGRDLVSWTFAKQEGFFDVVTYTGNGVAGREIPHNLGSEPGMIIVKQTSNSRDWVVYHRSLGAGKYFYLNKTDAAVTGTGVWNNVEPTSSVFTVASGALNNANGATYVAYVFAHDAQEFGTDSDESIIKCGSYTGNDSSDGPEIDLGWEPQWVLIKSSNGSYPWIMFDNMRGIVTGGNDPYVESNSTAAEASVASFIDLKPTGFKLTAASNYSNGSGKEYIYMAIRRPMKPAEEFDPDELFATVEGTSNATPATVPGFISGFPVDMAWYKTPALTGGHNLSARLMQGKYLTPESSAAQGTLASNTFDHMNGWKFEDANTVINSWMFRRAPGFFDVVTYAGDGVNGREVPHNLAAVPEMIWIKNGQRSNTSWQVYSKSIGNEYRLELDGAGASTGPSASFWNSTTPTKSVFTLSGELAANGSGEACIAYLWASVPGICDIGSYTGTGANRNIDCGFTNGARFVLIKKYEGGAGSWYYFDTLRGIVTRSSPYLLLNTTQAQSTDPKQSVSPVASGFSLLNSLDAEAANYLNTTGHKYIYMAIA